MRVSVLLAVFIAALWAASPLSIRLEQHKELDKLTKDLTRVNRDNRRLKTDIHNLKESPDYIEWLARKDLGLIKPDEDAFVVIESRKRNR